MKVLKFGGGCLKDAESIKKLPKILKNYQDDNILIVLSAFGKLTNMLEDNDSFNKNYHHAEEFIKTIMCSLDFSQEKIDFIWNKNATLYWLSQNTDSVKSYPNRVCFGEYISSEIISVFLANIGVLNTLEDAAFRVKTNSWDPISKSANFHSIQLQDDKKNTFPDFTDKLFAKQYWGPKRIKITQGFIASDVDNNIFVKQDLDTKNSVLNEDLLKRTTLGREGSDYSAAIFGSAWLASQVILFKDVDGVYTQDPKNYKDAELFCQLNYDDAFKLCYAGSTVIHPKTINHLKLNNIPLLIKSFLDFNKPGTLISNCASRLKIQ